MKHELWPEHQFEEVVTNRAMLFIHGVISSTLYIIGVFIAGLIWNHPVAVILAILTAAGGYLSAFIQLGPQSPSAQPLAVISVWTTITCGAIAGLSLLW